MELQPSQLLYCWAIKPILYCLLSIFCFLIKMNLLSCLSLCLQSPLHKAESKCWLVEIISWTLTYSFFTNSFWVCIIDLKCLLPRVFTFKIVSEFKVWPRILASQSCNPNPTVKFLRNVPIDLYILSKSLAVTSKFPHQYKYLTLLLFRCKFLFLFWGSFHYTSTICWFSYFGHWK